MPKVGDQLGEYRIVSQLNEGGMATLVLGRRIGAPEEEAPAAIKVVHEHLSGDWQFLRMFVDEAMISCRIRHPNVVRVDELGEEEGVYFLVMEYVRGCSLAQLLGAMAREGRRMRPEIAAHIAAEVASGLHAAHEMLGYDGANLGVIHRDISPQNILLSHDGSVKLLDFGIAKARGRAERTETGVIKGKIRYMAPEQITAKGIDRRIDIYALGVVLWEMLTMRRYIEGKNEIEILRKVQWPDRRPPSLLAEGIPRSLDEVVLRALETDRERRVPTAEAFRAELTSALSSTGEVGAPHVAELLRVFMADAIEASVRALPAEVAAPLTQELELSGLVSARDEATTVARRRSSEALTAEFRIEGESFTTDEVLTTGALQPYAEVEEDPTVEASKHEVAAMLAHAGVSLPPSGPKPASPSPPSGGPPRAGPPPRAPSGSPHAIPAPPARSAAPTPTPAPPSGSSAPSEPSGGLRRLGLLLVVLTFASFAVGAGVALLWLRFSG